MIRIAAVGDVHYDKSSSGILGRHMDFLGAHADVLLLAGDLTRTGHQEEGQALADDLARSPVPVVAVLGNHDYHQDHEERIRENLVNARVTVLQRESSELKLKGSTLGIAGLKGFGGGFAGACASDFGEREMKDFIRHTIEDAQFLTGALAGMKTDFRVALMHYAPIAGTLHGERREIYPFLGSYLLGEAIDQGGADLVIHGHAHGGVERGQTPAGIPVRNVAQAVIRRFFNIYFLSRARTGSEP